MPFSLQTFARLGPKKAWLIIGFFLLFFVVIVVFLARKEVRFWITAPGKVRKWDWEEITSFSTPGENFLDSGNFIFIGYVLESNQQPDGYFLLTVKAESNLEEFEAKENLDVYEVSETSSGNPNFSRSTLEMVKPGDIVFIEYSKETREVVKLGYQRLNVDNSYEKPD